MVATSTPSSPHGRLNSAARQNADDADLGFATTTSPLGFAAGDENLYRYVGNSPTNYTDPSGRFAETKEREKASAKAKEFETAILPFLDKLKALAKKAKDKERGGQLTKDTKTGKYATNEYQTEKNTADEHHREWAYPEGHPKEEESGSHPFKDKDGVVDGDSDKLEGDRSKTIDGGWHAHPWDGDASPAPSTQDGEEAHERKLVELVIKYDGVGGFTFYIVDIDGKCYRFEPKAKKK